MQRVVQRHQHEQQQSPRWIPVLVPFTTTAGLQWRLVLLEQTVNAGIPCVRANLNGRATHVMWFQVIACLLFPMTLCNPFQELYNKWLNPMSLSYSIHLYSSCSMFLFLAMLVCVWATRADNRKCFRKVKCATFDSYLGKVESRDKRLDRCNTDSAINCTVFEERMPPPTHPI